MSELESIHSSGVLSAMDKFRDIEKARNQIEESCTFIERIIQHGNVTEVLTIKKYVSRQLLRLLNNLPSPVSKNKVEFVSASEKFENAVKSTFGFIQEVENGIKVCCSE